MLSRSQSTPSRHSSPSCLILAVFLPAGLALVATAAAVEYPGGAPGEARGWRQGTAVTLENAAIAATWEFGDGPRCDGFRSREVPNAIDCVTRPWFVVHTRDGKAWQAAQFQVDAGGPRVEKIAPVPGALRAAERCGGQRVAARLIQAKAQLTVDWEADLRDGSNYIRQRWTVASQGPASPTRLELFDGAQRLRIAPRPTVAGAVDGSPVVAGPFFAAVEHPMATARADGNRIHCSVGVWEKPGEVCRRSVVVGVAPPGQERRAFLYYVERERPRPYAPFLHYNSWYDIAWGDRKMNEAQCLEVIDQFAREFIRGRGATLDSLVFDDGWDDNRTLWGFHSGFPRGFTPLTEAAAKCNTSVGVWLSPFGGYGTARDERLRYGATQGFETNRNGFALSGPRYYARFREACLEMIRKYKVNYFKFDGIAQGMTNTGAGNEFAADVNGLLRLVGDLRVERPDVFVNITTGTWPSPFWLFWGDSVWRNELDMGFHGPGSRRQQWITYRDMITYRYVVRRGPLFPLNSLMTQGICHSRVGTAAEMTPELKDMADEFRSFFASGTQLQELYIQPQRFTPAMWDLLAEGAKWSRANAATLADVHWIGGDPGKGEVYGEASWSPKLGIVWLRNPSTKPQTFALDAGKALELPPRDWQLKFAVSVPWRGRETSPQPGATPAPVAELTAGSPQSIALAPWEVLVLELRPK